MKKKIELLKLSRLDSNSYNSRAPEWFLNLKIWIKTLVLPSLWPKNWLQMHICPNVQRHKAKASLRISVMRRICSQDYYGLCLHWAITSKVGSLLFFFFLRIKTRSIIQHFTPWNVCYAEHLRSGLLWIGTLTAG